MNHLDYTPRTRKYHIPPDRVNRIDAVMEREFGHMKNSSDPKVQRKYSTIRSNMFYATSGLVKTPKNPWCTNVDLQKLYTKADQVKDVNLIHLDDFDVLGFTISDLCDLKCNHTYTSQRTSAADVLANIIKDAQEITPANMVSDVEKIEETLVNLYRAIRLKHGIPSKFVKDLYSVFSGEMDSNDFRFKYEYYDDKDEKEILPEFIPNSKLDFNNVEKMIFQGYSDWNSLESMLLLNKEYDGKSGIEECRKNVLNKIMSTGVTAAVRRNWIENGVFTIDDFDMIQDQTFLGHRFDSEVSPALDLVIKDYSYVSKFGVCDNGDEIAQVIRKEYEKNPTEFNNNKNHPDLGFSTYQYFNKFRMEMCSDEVSELDEHTSNFEMEHENITTFSKAERKPKFICTLAHLRGVKSFEDFCEFMGIAYIRDLKYDSIDSGSLYWRKMNPATALTVINAVMCPKIKKAKNSWHTEIEYGQGKVGQDWIHEEKNNVWVGTGIRDEILNDYLYDGWNLPKERNVFRTKLDSDGVQLGKAEGYCEDTGDRLLSEEEILYLKDAQESATLPSVLVIADVLANLLCLAKISIQNVDHMIRENHRAGKTVYACVAEYVVQERSQEEQEAYEEFFTDQYMEEEEFIFVNPIAGGTQYQKTKILKSEKEVIATRKRMKADSRGFVIFTLKNGSTVKCLCAITEHEYNQRRERARKIVRKRRAFDIRYRVIGVFFKLVKVNREAYKYNPGKVPDLSVPIYLTPSLGSTVTISVDPPDIPLAII